MLTTQLFHDGKQWILDLTTDDGNLQLAVTDVQAAMLQEIGIEVFAA